MGANNSTENNSSNKINEPTKNNTPVLNTNDIVNYSKLEPEEIFSKMTSLSNEILDSFNENFLGEEFCNKVALVYKKKMETLNIKVLREIQDKLENEENTLNLKLMLQHVPKNNNEKFFVDFFHDRLNEYFHKKGVKYQKRILESNNVSLKNMNDNIESEINYIDPFHVNQLLKKSNNQEGGNEFTNSNLEKELNKLNKKKINKRNIIVNNDNNDNNYNNSNNSNNNNIIAQINNIINNSLNKTTNNQPKQNNNQAKQNNSQDNLNNGQPNLIIVKLI